MKNKAQDLMITISAFGLLIVLSVGAFAVAGKLIIAKNPTFMSGEEFTYKEITVEAGDTLWSIAQAQAPGEDPRDVVGSMRDLNDLTSADIFPGQVLTMLVKQNVQPRQLAERLMD